MNDDKLDLFVDNKRLGLIVETGFVVAFTVAEQKFTKFVLLLLVVVGRDLVKPESDCL